MQCGAMEQEQGHADVIYLENCVLGSAIGKVSRDVLGI